MKITSPAFTDGGKIPSKYSCDDQNINPALNFSDVPIEAMSLVLIMDDPDIPNFAKQKYNTEVWDHWIVFNIPPTTRNVSEGKNPPGDLGRNTNSNNSYGGPCPPDREHRYFFKLYALDSELNLPEGSTKAEVEEAMQGHILAEAKLMGRYERVKK
ncbi:MAG TPA: YbhB/YbcL family Raf kinase inhibitor-like protein [Candidatus Nanoarchaeia archaeon]|nr:YbhB/YbcL family Raf kinase inhibitor-like protein [Candidatus Nanoarchaeia archaeon]